MNPFELNGTFVIFIGLFLVFMFLLNEIMLKPVGKVIDERKARIDKDYKAAQHCAVEGESVVEHYQKHMREVRMQAQKAIHDALGSANNGRDRQLKQVQLEGQTKIEQIKQELGNERKALLGQLIEPELELVADITSKLLGESKAISINRAEVERALEEAK